MEKKDNLFVDFNVSDSLKKRIKKVLKKNYYLNIDENQILLEIKETISKYQPINQENEEKIYFELIKKFDSYIDMSLENPQQALILINNYINYNITISTSEIEWLKELHKIKGFLIHYNYSLDIDFIIGLLKLNQKLEELVNKLFTRYNTLFIRHRYDSIDDDDFIISLIESFCLLNNIELIDLDENKEENNHDNQIIGKYNSLSVYKNSIDNELLSEEEEHYLIEKIQKGDKLAKDKLIRTNIRLVASIAKRYVNRGLDYQDLMQEGCLGLITAAEKFSYSKSNKFSTYATIWIRQAIVRSIDNTGRIIRVPVITNTKLNKYLRVCHEFEEEFGKRPTDSDDLEICRRANFSLNTLKRIRSINYDTTSLNKNIIDSEQDAAELIDLIADENVDVEYEVYKRNLKQKLPLIFQNAKLTKNEIFVLTKRFNLDGQGNYTFNSIACMMSISHERAHQLEVKAISKLQKYFNINTDKQKREEEINNKKLKQNKEGNLIEEQNQEENNNNSHYSINTYSVENDVYALYTGRYYGKCYTIEQISSVLNLDPNEVLIIINQKSLLEKQEQDNPLAKKLINK